jgi:serine protease
MSHTTRPRSILLYLAAAITAAAPASARADAYGDPVIANTSTAGNQWTTGAFSCGRGSAILWEDVPRGNGLYSRLFSAGGIALQASERFIDPAGSPVAGVGCFGTAEAALNGSDNDVFVTIYDALGNVVVPRFLANSEMTAGDQFFVAVAVNASGQFVVTWQSFSAGQVQAYVKRFRANGTAVAPAQLAFTRPSGGTMYQQFLAINNQGAFVTAVMMNTSTIPDDVWIRSYSADGLASTPALLASVNDAGYQFLSSLAIGPAGDFVVAWESTAQADSTARLSLWARHFSASGAALTGDVSIPVAVEGLDMHNASVAVGANGGFLVAWHDLDRVAGGAQVRAASYTGAGAPRGAPFAVSTASAQYNYSPQIAMDVDGNATIAWTRVATATSDSDIAVRRFQPVGITVQPIADGQTIPSLSGATGSWQYFKVTVPPGHNILDVSIAGSVGDADLYVRYGALPSATGWDGRPFVDGSNEAVEMVNFPPGDWYIGVNGFAAYSALTLHAASR